MTMLHNAASFLINAFSVHGNAPAWFIYCLLLRRGCFFSVAALFTISWADSL